MPRSVFSTPRGLPARGPRNSRYVSHCLHLFFSITKLILHVWLSSKSTFLRNQASDDFVDASPATCTKVSSGCRLTGKPSDSKPEILGSNPGVPDNFLGRPDSRVSQTVLKTAAVNNRVRFDSVAFRHFGDVA